MTVIVPSRRRSVWVTLPITRVGWRDVIGQHLPIPGWSRGAQYRGWLIT